MSLSINVNVYGASVVAGNDARSWLGDVMAAAANALGLTPQELRRQLASGQGLEDIAKASGKSVDDLRSAMLQAAQSATGGAPTDLQPRIDKLIQARHGRHGHGHQHHGGAQVLGAASEFLGVNPQDLETKLASGQSLADIAQGAGKSADDLAQAILNALELGGTSADAKWVRAMVTNAPAQSQDGGLVSLLA